MKPDKGITLVELVMAIAIVSVAVAALMNAYSQSVNASADPMIQRQMLAIAEAMMEEIRSYPYLDSVDVAGGMTPLPLASVRCTSGQNVCGFDPANTGKDYTVGDLSGSFGSGFGAYSINVRVLRSSSDLDTDPSIRDITQKITVTVSHTAMPNDIVLVGYRTCFEHDRCACVAETSC